MPETDKAPSVPEVEALATNVGNPLVFISHDSRDADLAEAFSKLLKSVSAGMIKTFRSSDKKGTDGIDFGDEWYKRLMTKLQSTSDVVCLFTERSLDRPWLLFEAGVAKGKLNTPVVGVALGVSLSRVSAGPFYQFQNMDDSEPDLTKLVNQLAKRVPGLELDVDVVKVQVAAFKTAEATILKDAGAAPEKKETSDETEASSVAKLVEEMKALPARVAERLGESGEPFRRRRLRRLNPMMLEELLHMAGEPGDPVGILMAASMVRDDAPWLYELVMEVYRAVKSGDREAILNEMHRLERFSDFGMHSPIMEEFAIGGRESHMFLLEFPRMLLHMLSRTIEHHPPRAFTKKRKPPTNS
ncbi:MAG TPA: toll/interleukin-1 receptor domain-containing protein [Thermoanaerobaculia bacterium]|jgi:hypothetical protein|nr:toll/interleukin-1 receptor domain-containing protein [Thermoanaerobaculia bacterium]